MTTGSNWAEEVGPEPPAPPAGDPTDPAAAAGQGTALEPALNATVAAEAQEWAEDAGAESAPQTYYGTSYEWFEQWLVPTWTRPLNASTATWCPHWWKHPEVVSRVESLWRAWEQLRLDAGTGMSVWWRDHGDHHLPVLLATDGPFKGCGPEKGHTARPVPLLPVEPAPSGLLDL